MNQPLKMFNANVPVPENLKKIFEELEMDSIVPHDINLPIYKYVTVETAKKILQGPTIKFSTPHELNDGDLETTRLKISLTKDQRIKFVNKLILEKIQREPSLINDKGFNQIFDIKTSSIKFNVEEKVLNNITLESHERQRNAFGIFCATSNPHSRNMWEKYGEKQKGICLELTFPTYFNKIFFTFHVAYVDDAYRIEIFDDKFRWIESSIHKWFFTKSKKYEFENEIRLFTDFRGIGKINKSFFTGIYFGPYCSISNIRAIDKILKKNKFNLNDRAVLKSSELV